MITPEQRRIDPNYLITLALVAETHNLSDAAKELGISQPGVSQQLKHLSDAVGQRLHLRSGHGVELSVAGEDLARRAREVYRAYRGVLDYVDSVAKGNDGLLLIAASNTVSAYILPRWLVRYRSKYPGVDLRTRSLNSSEVTELVIAGEFEVGVIESPSEEPIHHRQDDQTVFVDYLYDSMEGRSHLKPSLPNMPITHYVGCH